MNVEKADITQAKDVALLHKKEIPTGFISSLHINVIKKLYERIINDEILFVLKDNGKIIGFVSCAMDTGRLYKRFLMKNLFQVLPYFLPKIFSLSFVKKVLETLTAPFKTKVEKEKEIPELLSIVVSSEVQARGLGKLLLDALEEELRKRGVEEYKVVAGEKLVAANKFYRKNGFELTKQSEIHSGEKSNIYVKTLQH